MPAKIRLTAAQSRQLAKTAELLSKERGYEICGARTKGDKLCERRAGWGTDHLGVGRCSYHGGKNQSPLAKGYKTGMHAQINYLSIAEKAQQLKEDRDVFDLREHVFLVEAIAQTLLEEAQNSADLTELVKVIAEATKIVQRLHDIEVGRRYVISVENLGNIITRVVEVIERHVSDPYLRSLIAEDIMRLQNQPLLNAIAVPAVVNEVQ